MDMSSEDETTDTEGLKQKANKKATAVSQFYRKRRSHDSVNRTIREILYTSDEEVKEENDDDVTANGKSTKKSNKRTGKVAPIPPAAVRPHFPNLHAL